MSSLVPLMLVPMLIWAAVWGYLWNLDAKIKRLEQEVRRTESAEEDL